jgi:beta-xylosidase
LKGEGLILADAGAGISKKPVWSEGSHLHKRDEYYYLWAPGDTTGLGDYTVFHRTTSTGDSAAVK